MKARLRTTSLSFSRQQQLLFSHLELALSPGQGLLIYGPNGSGKTSLLRVLAGLLQASEGRVEWEGQDIQSAATSYHQHLHFLGHASGIKNGLSVQENLLYSQSLASTEPPDPQKLEQALEYMQLLSWRDQLAQQLSAGQKRRLALARLLATPKPLWILDEPFTNLDQASQQAFSQTIEEHLGHQGIVIIAAHHPLAIKEKNCFQELHLRSADV